LPLEITRSFNSKLTTCLRNVELRRKMPETIRKKSGRNTPIYWDRLGTAKSERSVPNP
jgi:hypothetical protein